MKKIEPLISHDVDDVWLKLNELIEWQHEMVNRRQSKEELLEVLRNIASRESRGDTEGNHVQADNLLLEYIGDDEITKAYKGIDRWYA